LGQIFSFAGRTGRLAYLGISLLQLLIIGIGFGLLLGTSPKGAAGLVVLVLMFGLSAWVGLAATVRRIRDMGWPMVLTLVGFFFVPMFSLLLLFWPGKPADFDATVFSDEDPRPAKAAKPQTESWMDRALAQASKGAQPAAPAPATPAPARFSGAMAAAQGPRTEFGLRR
jgi:hypothetical protein